MGLFPHALEEAKSQGIALRPKYILREVFDKRAVDYEIESKKERIWGKDAERGKWKEEWTGVYVFENEWPSFRTRQDRRLELVSALWPCLPGRRKLAVKVVNIFGNNTTKTIEITL